MTDQIIQCPRPSAQADAETPAAALDAPLLKLLRWAADYYHHPLGAVAAAARANLARDGARLRPIGEWWTLTAEGAAAHAAAEGYHAWLLHGITGSGKTEVYLQLVGDALAAGRRALVLVPEIGLTPQLVSRFAARLRVPLAVLHSGLTDVQRLAAWRAVLRGEARVVLGTRSAVFAAVADLGIIVVDEEHNASFKQQEGGFRYSARDVAIVRAQQLGIPDMLGSATPALETLHNAQSGRYTRLLLPRRTAHAGLSATARGAIERHLAADGQVLVYINRRGYAPTLACAACRWIAPCTQCDARLTVYRSADRLRCHHCGAERPLLRQCPQCGYVLKTVGQGTKRAVRSLGGRLDLGEAQIRDDLESGAGPAFDDTRSYRGVFQLAERARGSAMPRAVIPRIRLESPKITRKLTTEWFARRGDERYERCMARAAAPSRRAGR